MATLIAQLTLTSSTVSTNDLDLTVTDTLTTAEPTVSNARLSIATGSATNILTTSDSTDTYVYVKNTDSTNYVELKDDGGTVWGVLNAGEFAFFVVRASRGLELQANTSACVVEYGKWTKG